MDSRPSFVRLLAGVALGAITSWVVLKGSFFLLRIAWDAYAAAHPQRAYTLAMLLVRLAIFSAMIAATSAVATVVSRDPRMPWLAGLIIFAVSIPDHLYPGNLWNEFPAWYHIAYLISIVPVALAAGRGARALGVRTAAAQQSAAADTS